MITNNTLHQLPDLTHFTPQPPVCNSQQARKEEISVSLRLWTDLGIWLLPIFTFPLSTKIYLLSGGHFAVCRLLIHLWSLDKTSASFFFLLLPFPLFFLPFSYHFFSPYLRLISSQISYLTSCQWDGSCFHAFLKAFPLPNRVFVFPKARFYLPLTFRLVYFYSSYH